jgi:hypothetical protein
MQLDNPLWQRIAQFHPDKPGVVLPFSKRLALENGWSRRYALRVVEEYKRFVFLARTAAHPVTPSEEIDQAWHLHMVYTRSYWEDFCGKILERPLHHSPTEGGKSELAKYMAQYEQTLQTYQETFGHAAPSDIWPPANQRFSAGLWRWVSLRKYWVIRKPFF